MNTIACPRCRVQNSVRGCCLCFRDVPPWRRGRPRRHGQFGTEHSALSGVKKRLGQAEIMKRHESSNVPFNESRARRVGLRIVTCMVGVGWWREKSCYCMAPCIARITDLERQTPFRIRLTNLVETKGVRGRRLCCTCQHACMRSSRDLQHLFSLQGKQKLQPHSFCSPLLPTAPHCSPLLPTAPHCSSMASHPVYV